MKHGLAGVGLGMILLGCAGADSPHLPVPSASTAESYLTTTPLARLTQATPAAPSPGSAEEAADHAAYAAYAALEDSDRWRLAQTHAELRPTLAMQHFDCPLGTRLSQSPPPALERLMARIRRAATAATEQVRLRERRPGPLTANHNRRICIRSPDLHPEGSYPSTPAAVGTLWGLVFAELAPDAAEALRRRGEEIGASQAICGLAYPADVAAGQALARTLYAEISQQPDYRADVAAARSEVAAARTLGRTNPACAAERRALDVQGRGWASGP